MSPNLYFWALMVKNTIKRSNSYRWAFFGAKDPIRGTTQDFWGNAATKGLDAVTKVLASKKQDSLIMKDAGTTDPTQRVMGKNNSTRSYTFTYGKCFRIHTNVTLSSPFWPYLFTFQRSSFLFGLNDAY